MRTNTLMLASFQKNSKLGHNDSPMTGEDSDFCGAGKVLSPTQI